MQYLFFVTFYPLLWLVSKLPFRLLYLLSDFVFVLVYHVVRYRRGTVRYNLEMAFPHLTNSQRRDIEQKSYRHLCDMFLEMAKTMSITEEEIDKRFVFTNLELYQDMEKEGKSIALFCAHYASYEWVISMNRFIQFEGFAIYKRIANRYFDKVVRDIRSRFKATLITTKETIPIIERNIATGKHGVYGFASDQSPKPSKTYHWGTFLGVETPMVTGSEMLAKKFDMNVIFLKVKKVRRGHYQATFEKPFEIPKNVPDYQISDAFMKMVEGQILEAPEYYLWTHKRWKNHYSNENLTDR